MLTREQQLEYCKQCTKRKFDMNKGVICGLTNDIATFEESCPDYENDPLVLQNANTADAFTASDVKHNLHQEAYEKIKQEQNFPRAVIVGFLASLLGAVLWALAAAVSGRLWGIFAVAVGALVGFAVQKSGKGIDQKFGILGAVLAVFGCFAGNVLGIMGYFSYKFKVDFFKLFNSDFIDVATKIYLDSVGFMSIIFYVIAIVEGYKFSFRRFTDRQVKELNQEYM
ncbi:hypothetical protein BKI52_08080 [marine bacterium AO1-C]|nr:hypothetical protein BKI52_08080 [marine bacterium AO1-C]